MTQNRKKLTNFCSFRPQFKLITHFIKQFCMLVDNLNDIVEIFTQFGHIHSEFHKSVRVIRRLLCLISIDITLRIPFNPYVLHTFFQLLLIRSAHAVNPTLRKFLQRLIDILAIFTVPHHRLRYKLRVQFADLGTLFHSWLRLDNLTGWFHCLSSTIQDLFLGDLGLSDVR